jgi:glycosyltransferase involved in cell wall biosynthesis
MTAAVSATDQRMKSSVSIVIPTYKRPADLAACLECICHQSNCGILEVIVLDNGQCDSTKAVVESFESRINEVAYIRNPEGHGLGYSVTTGARIAKYDIVLELNDDALLPPTAIADISRTFFANLDIGIVGVRAIEDGYLTGEGTIGVIDPVGMRIVGNFAKETKGLVDVEHVYGFCYAYRRSILAEGATHDFILIARDFSNGCCLETDHCLTAKRLGWRIVYDGRIGVVHLAKPRQDISEMSLKWRYNNIRNTTYLFLKHFGLFGRSCIATRYMFLFDLGIKSAVLSPSRANWRYFLHGAYGRASGLFYYAKFLAFGNKPLHKVLDE